MANERLTIGELSRQSGVPVKTLRYYSDEGLLPTSGRSRANYRLYGEEARMRLDLVRTLREAGLPIESIKKVLRREMSLADALRLRLAAVEAHVVSLQQVGAALRAALRSEPDEDDIRRLCAVTRLTNEERKAKIEEFFERVSDGIPIDEEWKKHLVETSAPTVPENPTPEQLDAWIELSELMSEPTFIANLRYNAQGVWGKFDLPKMKEAENIAVAAAREALKSGTSPESNDAKRAIETYAKAMAAALGKPFGAITKQRMHDHFLRHDQRASRYWELVGILRGWAPSETRVKEWEWIRAGVLHHFRP